jgi:predicted  nucleic acid-binding Zn-ribbon protein
MTEPGMHNDPPTRVCSKCSTQSQNTGDFCPHCGASYIKHRRRPGRKSIIAVAAAVIVIVGVGTGIALKVNHDRDQQREQAAEERQQAEREAEEEAQEARDAADAAEAQREARRQAKLALEAAERKIRKSIIRQMQTSITEDARERVGEGDLEGPIMYTSCDPLGGGSVDDLTALTTTFDCIAVNEELGGGRVSGYGFASTVNWDEGSWTWQLDA